MDEKKKGGTTRISGEAVREKTGKAWEEWYTILDGWDVGTQGHTATARRLREELGVGPWWAQAVTGRYERTRGLRP